MSRYRLFAIVAAVVAAVDQLTKVWARSALPRTERGGDRVPVIDGYWDWMLEYNYGSAFSLFEGGAGARIFLSVIALAALGVMVYLVRGARDRDRGLITALGLMAGGAVGNLIERVGFGKVTDFVLWHWQDQAYWPVFNVADVALVAAVPLFLVFGYRAEKAAKAAAVDDRSNA